MGLLERYGGRHPGTGTLVHGGINTLLCQLTISGSSQVSHTPTRLHGSLLILGSTRDVRSPRGLEPREASIDLSAKWIGSSRD